jgi:hypothetical protein
MSDFLWTLILYHFRKIIIIALALLLFLNGLFNEKAPEIIRFISWEIVIIMVFLFVRELYQCFVKKSQTKDKKDHP